MSSQEDSIVSKKALVIEVIDNSKVVVNAGRINGIESGSQCQITAPSRDIIDPFTNENLGSLSLKKGYAQVTQLYEKFCVVRAYAIPRGINALIKIAAIGDEPAFIDFLEVVEIGDEAYFTIKCTPDSSPKT